MVYNKLIIHLNSIVQTSYYLRCSKLIVNKLTKYYKYLTFVNKSAIIPELYSERLIRYLPESKIAKGIIDG